MQCTSKSKQDDCKVNGTQYFNILSAVKSYKKSLNITDSIAHSAFGKDYNTPKINYLGTSKVAY